MEIFISLCLGHMSDLTLFATAGIKRVVVHFYDGH